MWWRLLASSSVAWISVLVKWDWSTIVQQKVVKIGYKSNFDRGTAGFFTMVMPISIHLQLVYSLRRAEAGEWCADSKKSHKVLGIIFIFTRWRNSLAFFRKEFYRVILQKICIYIYTLYIYLHVYIKKLTIKSTFIQMTPYSIIGRTESFTLFTLAILNWLEITFSY